jgi:hypothetical protein
VIAWIRARLGNLPTKSTMSTRTFPRAPLVAALVLGCASGVFAAPSAEEEAKRLDDEQFFVEALKRGWEPLLADCERTVAAVPAAENRPVRVRTDDVREKLATLRDDGTEAGETRALTLFETLAGTAVDEQKRPKFHGSCAKILMTRADRAEAVHDDAHDAQALENAKLALAHVKAHPKAIDLIGRLGFKVGLAQEGREEYDEALSQFEATLKALRDSDAKDDAPKVVEGRGHLDRILKSTGPLAVRFLGDPEILAKVTGPKLDYTHAVLRFAGAGKAPREQTADKPRRMRVGSWQVTATGKGGDAPYKANVAVTPQGGVVTLLAMLPEGMVLVPAAGGDDDFLIDRTEVSNEQWQRLGGAPRGGGPRAAASGMTFQEARDWAARNGRSLPTLAQWTHAAFGAPNAETPVYPWGDDEGVPGRHYAQEEPLADVEGCPEGRSRASGCLNMVGNLWEWLDDGQLIGGGYKTTKIRRGVTPAEGQTFEPWTADVQRKPFPLLELYESWPVTRREQYRTYHGNESTVQLAGLRCVVPLGKPRR